jgi:hypothetical protein
MWVVSFNSVTNRFMSFYKKIFNGIQKFDNVLYTKFLCQLLMFT